MKRNDVVIFRLFGSESATITDSKTKAPKKYPATFRVASKALIVPPESSGKYGGEEVYIRYMKGSETIFEKEQPKDVNHRSLRVPEFVNGILAVRTSDKHLLEFLRNHPQNRDCPNGDNHNVTKKFYEFNPEAIAKKENEKRKRQNDFLQMATNLDYLTEILPMATLVGLDTSKNSDLVKYDFFRWVEDNTESFEDIVENESHIVDRMAQLIEALNARIIDVVGQSFRYSKSKKDIVTFSAGQNAMEEMVEWTYGKGRETWETIFSILQDSKVKKEEAEAETDILQELKNLSTKDLVDKAKDNGVIVMKGAYAMFGDINLGNSTKKVSETVESDQAIKNSIQTKLYALIKVSE